MVCNLPWGPIGGWCCIWFGADPKWDGPFCCKWCGGAFIGICCIMWPCWAGTANKQFHKLTIFFLCGINRAHMKPNLNVAQSNLCFIKKKQLHFRDIPCGLGGWCGWCGWWGCCCCCCCTFRSNIVHISKFSMKNGHCIVKMSLFITCCCCDGACWAGGVGFGGYGLWGDCDGAGLCAGGPILYDLLMLFSISVGKTKHFLKIDFPWKKRFFFVLHSNRRICKVMIFFSLVNDDWYVHWHMRANKTKFNSNLS